MIKRKKSAALFERAQEKIPGAVNSPVRAWKAVGRSPLFVARGEGAYLFDADGNRFIDYVGSYGAAILGHANPDLTRALARQARNGLCFGAPTRLEVELAELISAAVGMAERVRLVNSGTEAGMTAIRIARAATGRQKIVKFDGCYHGHSDSLLVRAGSGGLTLGVPDSAGVPEAIASLTAVATYSDLESIAAHLNSDGKQIAAVIVEPVAANMGVVLPAPDFLRQLSDLTHSHGALLICDEVITGFRLRFGAISEWLGAEPDLVMLGKIIGGGMPIGAVAGPKELMDLLAPTGPVYQAGTLSGNLLSVRGGIETLQALRAPGTYERLETLGSRLAQGLREALEDAGESGCVNWVGSLGTMFFGPTQVRNAQEARESDTQKFARFFHAMIERGINMAPSQFEAIFVSLAHSGEEIDRTISAARDALRAIADD